MSYTHNSHNEVVVGSEILRSPPQQWIRNMCVGYKPLKWMDLLGMKSEANVEVSINDHVNLGYDGIMKALYNVE